MLEEPMTSMAPGWDSIIEALMVVYGDREPVHWGTVTRYSAGGPDPLDGVSAYDAGDHWHYVSFGLTELYYKGDNTPEDRSGWGFELTFRLRKAGDAPPMWPVNLLQNLARYVFRSGHGFDVGHKIALNAPIDPGAETAITSVLFVSDPELQPMDTPHGHVRFLQVVGITDDERLAASAWDAKKLAALAARDSPLLVTDPGRESWLADAAFREGWERGRVTDGSSTGMEFVTQLGWRFEGGVPVVLLGAIAVPAISLVLPGRVPFGQPYTLATDSTGVLFLPGEGALEAEADGEDLVVHMPPELAMRFPKVVRPERGRYELDGLVVEVAPTEIRDPSGAVVRVIG